MTNKSILFIYLFLLFKRCISNTQTFLNIKNKMIPLEKPLVFPLANSAISVARLGGSPPNWAVLNLIVRVNIGLGGYTKFGLVFGQFGGFQNI